MSIATVVLRGFGTSSYADINKLPTLGYSTGSGIIPSVGTPDEWAIAPFRGLTGIAPMRGNSAVAPFRSAVPRAARN